MSFLMFGVGTGKKNIEISADQYAKVLAYEQIVKTLDEIENLFSLFANSFVEFEEYMIKLVFDDLYRGYFSLRTHDFFDESKQLLNLKLAALLTTSRAHYERTCQLIKQCDRFRMDPQTLFSEQWDDRFEYRLMYALRNIMQHAGLPLENVYFSSRTFWEGGSPSDANPCIGRHTVNPRLNTSALAEAPKLNSKFRSELLNLNQEHIDLKFVTRGFVESVASCQASIRKATQPALDEVLVFHSDLLMEFETTHGTQAVDPFVKEGAQSDGSKTDVSSFLARRLLKKRKMWGGLVYVQRHYVSSEVNMNHLTFPEQDSRIWIRD